MADDAAVDDDGDCSTVLAFDTASWSNPVTGTVFSGAIPFASETPGCDELSQLFVPPSNCWLHEMLPVEGNFWGNNNPSLVGMKI